MEIIGGSAALPEAAAAKGSNDGTDDAVMRAFAEARRDVLGAKSKDDDVHDVREGSPSDVVATASVEKAKGDDSVLGASVDTSDSGDGKVVSTAKDLLAGDPSEGKSPAVEITRAMKDEFLDCVVSGKRYMSTETLYGGRLKVTIRCRSLDETDAIESYLRRMVALGRISSPSEYTHAARRCLLVAQVAEVNGVEYREMDRPYKFVETAKGLEPPAWESQMDVFGRMPEQVVSALSGCVLRFETAYWRMVSMSGDENFWNPGESTGE